MNLWVNRLRQLTLLAVALFFFACEDETSLNGFKNPNPKFQGKYVEIPLTTSNLLLGDIRTSNYSFYDEYSRFLVGSYIDPDLDTVEAMAVTQFFTATGAKLATSDNPKIDSISLHLAFDLYLYGSKETKNQVLSVYYVQDEIGLNRKTTYYDSDVALGEKLAEKTFSVNPGLFKDYRDRNANPEKSDTTVVVKMKLHGAMVEKLKRSIIRYSYDSAIAFNSPNEFVEDFHGLAFKSGSKDNSMIMGFSTGSLSRVVIHYHNDKTDSLTHSLIFNNPYFFSYNKIKSRRVNNPDLAGLQKFQQQSTEAGNRYIQSGTGLVTKLHMDKFFEFAEAQGDKNIVLNSAQLVVDGVVTNEVGHYEPPTGLALRLINEQNRLVKFTSGDDLELLTQRLISADYQLVERNSFVRNAVFNSDSVYYAVSDLGNPVSLTYDSDDKKYSGFLTLLCQKLYNERGNAPRFNSFVLYPASPSAPVLGAKSVNRAIFPSDKVVLRIYYTEPTVKD